MSYVTQNQPDGTPTWIDLGIPDLERAMEFYGALFGWEFEVGMPEFGYYTICLLDGRRVAGLAPTPEPSTTEFWWNVSLATDDIDATFERIEAAGAEVVQEPIDQPYGVRDCAFRDPAGNHIRINQKS